MHFIAENMKMPTETNRNLLEYIHHYNFLLSIPNQMNLNHILVNQMF